MKDEHLGDGVYISFDGYQWWLAVNNHTNKVVALEPGMISRIVDYEKRTYKFYNKISQSQDTATPTSDN